MIERLRRRRGRDSGAEAGRSSDRGAAETDAEPSRDPATERELVFYRCPTPTDVLCPCGAVARRLRKLDVPYRVERVPYRRSGRPEVVELTGQRRVPLLIDGPEIVHDSRRIVEYLQWRYGGAGDDGEGPGPGPA